MNKVLICYFALAAALRGETIAAKTAGRQKLAGYFPLYWEAKTVSCGSK